MRGTVLVMALVLATGGLAWGQGKVTHPDPRAERVVAAVLTGVGEAQGELTVSYPTKVERGQAEADLAAVQAASGWQLGTLTLTGTGGETQMTVPMTPGAAVRGGQDAAVWPLVMALRRYDRIGVALLGQTPAEAPGHVDNQYVHGVWSGGGGLSSFDVTIKDRGFDRAEQLRRGAQAEGPAPGAEAQTVSELRRLPLWAWVLAALVLAGLAYVVVSKLGQGREVSEPARAASSRAWRSRRARNVYK